MHHGGSALFSRTYAISNVSSILNTNQTFARDACALNVKLVIVIHRYCHVVYRQESEASSPPACEP